MFGESFYHCLSRLKRPLHSSLPPIPRSPTASAATITTTPSSSGAITPSSSGVVTRNFNSLYDTISDYEATLTLTIDSFCDCAHEHFDGGASPTEQELSEAIASHRLLLSSPGRSNSIVDSAVIAFGAGTGLAVQTFSLDPYSDFRRSMEEMVEALGLDVHRQSADLHELLLCYLALNGEHAHKYIASAFADLLRELCRGCPRMPAHS